MLSPHFLPLFLYFLDTGIRDISEESSLFNITNASTWVTLVKYLLGSEILVVLGFSIEVSLYMHEFLPDLLHTPLF